MHYYIGARTYYAVIWIDLWESTDIEAAHSCPDACNSLCNDIWRHTLTDGKISNARECPHQAVQDPPGRHAAYAGASGA